MVINRPNMTHLVTVLSLIGPSPLELSSSLFKYNSPSVLNFWITVTLPYKLRCTFLKKPSIDENKIQQGCCCIENLRIFRKYKRSWKIFVLILIQRPKISFRVCWILFLQFANFFIPHFFASFLQNLLWNSKFFYLQSKKFYFFL